MKIQYLGHSCLSVEVANKTLLFDPFITPNPKAAEIKVEKLTADYLLITHAHQDHMADAVDIAKRTGAQVVSNFEIVNWFSKQGVNKGHGMNHGGAWKFDFGRVKLVNAIHSSSFPDGSYGGNPGGFVVETPEGAFYHSGDTALTQDMKLMGDALQLKWAALCIGDNFTMGIDDAVKAADMIRCDTIIGIHYDTFPPIEINHEEAVKKFKASRKHLRLMGIGDTIEL